uniref:Family with sequence similarity 167 member B n=1 Tax=Pelodiscus sinensis TaxID=13735 RepID=K7G3A9_PELSI
MSFSHLKFKELGEEEANADKETLDSVKALTAKLKLQTRRPSYLEWTARVQSPSWRSGGKEGSIGLLKEEQGGEGNPADAPSRSICGFGTMEDALAWLRKELQEMQAVDHQLAQQLMRLGGRHKEMLDDATFGLEGCEEDSDLLCNIPPKAAFLLSTPLKHIGVTRMNINSRRFSLC